MDRTDLAAYIVGQFAPLLNAAGQSAAVDDILGYGPALDAVMRQLGLDVQSVDPDPTVLAGTEPDALALTRYYVLDWLLIGIAALVDVTDGKDREARSQLTKQVMMLLDRAQSQLPPQYNVTQGDFAYGRLQLDIFEPNVFSGLANPGYRLG